MINKDNVWEYLVAYLDDELSESERKEVEEFMTAHPAYSDEFTAVKQTKIPAPSVHFSNPDILLIKSSRIRPIPMWIKITAAASFLIALLGMTNWFMNNLISKRSHDLTSIETRIYKNETSQPAQDTSTRNSTIQKMVANTNQVNSLTVKHKNFNSSSTNQIYNGQSIVDMDCVSDHDFVVIEDLQPLTCITMQSKDVIITQSPDVMKEYNLLTPEDVMVNLTAKDEVLFSYKGSAVRFIKEGIQQYHGIRNAWNLINKSTIQEVNVSISKKQEIQFIK